VSLKIQILSNCTPALSLFLSLFLSSYSVFCSPVPLLLSTYSFLRSVTSTVRSKTKRYCVRRGRVRAQNFRNRNGLLREAVSSLSPSPLPPSPSSFFFSASPLCSFLLYNLVGMSRSANQDMGFKKRRTASVSGEFLAPLLYHLVFLPSSLFFFFISCQHVQLLCPAELTNDDAVGPHATMQCGPGSSASPPFFLVFFFFFFPPLYYSAWRACTLLIRQYLRS